MWHPDEFYAHLGQALLEGAPQRTMARRRRLLKRPIQARCRGRSL